MAQQEAARNGMPPDPKVQLREQQAQALAKVLYGVKDNSEQDLRTMCWCVFNRVDSPDYPDTLEEVIDQPQQWMRYDPENPVIDNLYKIAEQELVAWQDGKTRPITSDFVYMNWTPNQIKLRNAWKDGSTTDYWRYGQ
jgi:spore germination cell wall hydrolase CwlJ-like protein